MGWGEPSLIIGSFRTASTYQSCTGKYGLSASIARFTFPRPRMSVAYVQHLCFPYRESGSCIVWCRASPSVCGCRMATGGVTTEVAACTQNGNVSVPQACWDERVGRRRRAARFQFMNTGRRDSHSPVSVTCRLYGVQRERGLPTDWHYHGWHGDHLIETSIGLALGKGGSITALLGRGGAGEWGGTIALRIGTQYVLARGRQLRDRLARARGAH